MSKAAHSSFETYVCLMAGVSISRACQRSSLAYRAIPIMQAGGLARSSLLLNYYGFRYFPTGTNISVCHVSPKSSIILITRYMPICHTAFACSRQKSRSGLVNKRSANRHALAKLFSASALNPSPNSNFSALMLSRKHGGGAWFFID